MATGITEERVKFLAKSESYPGDIAITGSRPGEELGGTEVVLIFPKKSC